MPREKKKRGRREETKDNKRKRDETAQTPLKRLKADDGDDAQAPTEIFVSGDAGDDFVRFDVNPPDAVQEPQEEDQFHGLLDPKEQEYYSNVNSKIVADDFESAEDRAIFIEAIHRETEGKELKVASSQSCSRYLEKIIMLSTAVQLRNLFTKFLGNFTYLVHHRFGSHCCETLFLEAAKHVGKEAREAQEDEESAPSMESLFLQVSEELSPNVGFLLTERFASHTIRVLFLILSGEPLGDDATKAMLASKRKEKLDTPAEKEAIADGKRHVPKSFGHELAKLIDHSVSSMDTSQLRALATHPTGNPVLQLLLRLELRLNGKKQPPETTSLFKKLLPDEDLEDDTESAKFICGLVYDPVGSHLVESLVQNLPGKSFKKLYRNVLKSRLGHLIKNDTASYVAIKILERLGKDDLAEAKGVILPDLPILLSRRRFGGIKILVERCTVRQVDLQDLSDLIKSEYGNDPASFLPRLFHGETSDKAERPEEGSKSKAPTSPYQTDIHASLLAQAMLQAPKICSLVQDGLLALDTDTLIVMSQHSASSRVIQSALSPTDTNSQFRRQFVPRFYDHVFTLSQDLTGSYVADALWSATEGLQFMKERLARELANNESQLRESPYGRNVWKNWAMDAYQRRPAEWRALAKGYDQNPDGNPSLSKDDTGAERKKTAIELARERHSQKKWQGAKQKTPATSANAIVHTKA